MVNTSSWNVGLGQRKVFFYINLASADYNSVNTDSPVPEYWTSSSMMVPSWMFYETVKFTFTFIQKLMTFLALQSRQDQPSVFLCKLWIRKIQGISVLQSCISIKYRLWIMFPKYGIFLNTIIWEQIWEMVCSPQHFARFRTYCDICDMMSLFHVKWLYRFCWVLSHHILVVF